MSPEEQKRIVAFVSNMHQVKGVHALRSRKLGDCMSIDLHLEVDGFLTIKDAHDVSEEVKLRLLKADFGIVDVMIHIEPFL
jgi:divalent metal cation (Fe/Co/Zn/Cd) transporter